MLAPRLAALGLALCASAALAEPPTGAPLTAEEFDALTRGLTFDTYSYGTVYGVEKFYPGGRSIWQDASRCMYGTWKQVGNQICFTYEDDPANPDCWTYFDEGGALSAYWKGDPTQDPIILRPTNTPMTCDEYMGV